MTDTNRPEAVHDVLRDMRQWKGDYSVFADRIERALSARASAGEGGVTVCHSEFVAARGEWKHTFWTQSEVKPGTRLGGVRIKTKGPDDFASHVCPAESSAVWNACVYEHERITEGLPPILSSTEVTPASPATGCRDSRNEAFNLADTVIEHIRCGQEQKARDAIMEAFTTSQTAATQGGEWVMVPREPTTEMLMAAGEAVHNATYWAAAYRAMLAAAPQPQEAPVPVRIDCPQCTAPHVDEGEWATRPHKTHQCQACGHEWRPFPYATVGTPPAQATVKESLTVHPAHGDGEGECKCACRTMANGMVHSHDCCAAPKNRDMAAGLYHAVNRMMAALGADGEISTRHPATQEVMAALTAIDGGQYMASAMHEVSDVQMAMHWIDRYASGIDDEPQFDRIAEALWHMHSAEADDALTTRPTPEADARDGRPTMRELIDVLPGVYYMAPPDGGSVSLLEQLQRMAQDAARYLWLRDCANEARRSDPACVSHPLDYQQMTILHGEQLDAAIDAALALPAQGEGK